MKLSQVINEVAEGVWDIYSLYCGLIGEEVADDFKDAPKWQKVALKDSVEEVITGSRSGDPISGEDVHSNWVVGMRDNNWKWGLYLDEKAKTHPAILSYDMLSVDQRSKADLVAAAIKGLAASLITTSTIYDKNDDEDELEEDDEDEDND